MSQMEYKTVTVRGALFNVAEALNKKYAPHGWRLVHPREGDNYTLCILERPVGYEETLEAEQPLHVVTQQRLELEVLPSELLSKLYQALGSLHQAETALLVFRSLLQNKSSFVEVEHG